LQCEAHTNTFEAEEHVQIYNKNADGQFTSKNRFKVTLAVKKPWITIRPYLYPDCENVECADQFTLKFNSIFTNGGGTALRFYRYRNKTDGSLTDEEDGIENNALNHGWTENPMYNNHPLLHRTRTDMAPIILTMFQLLVLFLLFM
jgi:hypothetical protein